METAAATSPLLISLYRGLSGRPRPEDVAAAIRELFAPGDLDRASRQALDRAARAARVSRTYLPVDFEQARDVRRQAALLAELLELEPLSEAQVADGAAVRDLLAVARARIGMREGETSFKHHRLDRAARRALGLELSRRRYDKLFRLVARLEHDVAVMEGRQSSVRLSRFAKSAFAAEVPFERFAAGRGSAAFVALMAANRARRSIFTNARQTRSFDTVAERLLHVCERLPDTDWFAIAHVFPRADVLARVAPEERVQLLERTLDVLRETSAELEVLAVRHRLDLRRMIVQRGDDSSTWNALAGAWNTARDLWLALVFSLGLEETFDGFLPGKVLRLMAADVVAWHVASDDGLHPDTRVWKRLPLPWDVLAGRATCTRADVEAACRAAGVDPARSGWSAPKPLSVVDAWRPTPETVHGVVVGHPELALFLRRIGAFSGKGLRQWSVH